MSGFSERVEYQVTVHVEDDGTYWAEVLEMPGCFASGDSMEELQESLAEAMGLYLSTPETRVVMQPTSVRPLEQVNQQTFLVSS